MFAISLLLASITASAPISYTETFEAGREVDIHQAFYVCESNNPRDLMDILITLRNPKTRYEVAKGHGCAFHLSDDVGPIYKVVAETATLCLDRETDGKNTYCGREGHQVVVERQGKQITVIQLSDDLDYD